MLPTVVGKGNRMLPFFRRKAEPNPGGDWWTDAFTQEERATIEGVFAPLGGGTAESLARSTNPNSLGTLAEYLKKEHLRHLGYKLLDRADTLVNENVPVLDLHFYFAVRGGFYYRWRDHDPFALDEAVKSFQRQIGLGANVARFFREDKNWGFIPAHAGYRQLRIIEEKRGNWTLARALCKQANTEGWADDWDHHIGRIDKNLAAMKTLG